LCLVKEIVMQNSMLLFMNIGTPELLVVLFAVLLLFGGKKLPELARGLGQGLREFKDASDDVKREIHRNINAIQEDLTVDLDSDTYSNQAKAQEAASKTNSDKENKPSDPDQA